MAEEDKEQTKPGILDTVSFQEQSATLRSFNPQAVVSGYLQKLNAREQQVLASRYGLLDGRPQTLEVIGKKLGLTRERVRQIEKEAAKKLNGFAMPASFQEGVELVFKIIEDRGNIVRENILLEIVLASNNSEVNQKGVLFILNLVPRFSHLKETTAYFPSWYVTGFDKELLGKVIGAGHEILKEAGKPLTKEGLFQKVLASLPAETDALSNEALESYLNVSKAVSRNPYQEWGHSDWAEIAPRDVGDKAYLVLLHHKQPEHYSKITEFINKQGFDQRTAHKETVHNELIKDKRFVLVGRGIYALKKWGYEPGVVADIITDILKKSGEPLTKEQIIEEVMKQRLVKRNTIVVGLSNRTKFRRTADNKYANAQ